MASSGNFNTYSPINVAGPAGTGTYTAGDGLTGGDTTSGSTSWVGTHFGFPSGKWYFEVRKLASPTGGWPRIGFYSMGGGGASLSSITSETSSNLSSLRLNQGDNTMNKYVFGSTSTSSVTGSISTGDILQVAIDVDAGKIWYGVNNTYLESGDPAGDSNPIDDYAEGTYNPVQVCVGTYNTPDLPDINFGQDSTFRGQRTAGGNADGNGFGDFAYAPPSGFLAMCSANLPTSDDIDPAQTDDNFPGKNFNVVTFTGNSSTNAVTGLGFQPDFIWGFTRDGNQSKRMIDSTRGGASRLYSDLTAAADTSNTAISAFGADGFTANGGYFNNDNGKECGAWCWRANGGTTSSNSSGSITSTVQTNPAQNFSIATYTGSGSAGATIGHGLSAKPAFILIKNTSDVDFWAVYHESIGADFYTSLTASVFSNNATFWNDTEPTSSVITLGTNNRVNGSSNSHVCYAWSQVEGYMKFSTYTGNGNADGPFVYTGFRPRMLFIKRNANGHNWITFDTATVTFNPVNEYANWDTGNASGQNASDKIDILSNGFKLRSTGSSFNNSGSEYVWGAWADVPAKYNNTF